MIEKIDKEKFLYFKISVDICMTQQYNCVMIPNLVKLTGSTWPVLPPGIHDATFAEVFNRYAINAVRVSLFDGLLKGVENLFFSGCPQVYLDGSYVTGKPIPNDYEICWEMAFVDPNLLDPVFFDFDNGRFNQKQKYLGEFFPASLIEGGSGKPFLDFFQTDKDTGAQKGIIKLTNHLKKGGAI